MKIEEIIKKFEGLRNERNRAGMKRFGIKVDRAFGISLVELRSLAKKIGKNHELALELWDSGYHEARMLAGLIDDPARVTKSQMDRWANDFDSWDLCDTVCGALFDKTPFAYEKALSYTRDEKSRTFSSNPKRSHILRTSSRSRRLILSSIVSFAVWLKCTRTI